MAEDSIQATFRTDKDTKNTRRFEEVTEVDGEVLPAEGLGKHDIGTLYVQSESLESVFGELPDGVRVTVEAVDPADEA